MSDTVPTIVKPSGAYVVPSSDLLNGIPSQPAARPRLVPARVGSSGCAQTVHIEDPTWCVVDHMDRVGCLEDVVHYSGFDIVEILTLLDDDSTHSELMVNISSDPTASDPRLREAHILINDATATDAHLTADMAEELADNLIAFAAQIRHKARIVRGGTA